MACAMLLERAARGWSMASAEGALERLFLNNADFDELSAAMDVFCPFDAAGMIHQEIRHSFFLSYMLDPARPHGFGTDCLRGLLWAAAEAMQGAAAGPLTALDVHLMALDDAVVTREHKGIDVLIEIPAERVVIAIELKIDAAEHGGQLGRYRALVRKSHDAAAGWRQLFLFLTKRGESPSADDGEGWCAFPLEQVTDAFDAVARRGGGHAEARMMLAAYVAMVRRRHLSDQRMEMLARKLWREHGEALDFLMSRRPDVASEVYQALTDQRADISARLSRIAGAPIEPDHSTTTQLRFAFPAWDDVPGMLEGTGWKPSRRLMLLIVRRDLRTGVARLHFNLGKGPLLHRQTVFDALRSAGAPIDLSYSLGDSRQLTFKDVAAPADDEDATAYQARLCTELEQFVARHFAVYDNAMSALRAATGQQDPRSSSRP